MTMKQPEVLRLASALVNRSHPTLVELCAAAELRRLHSVNAELLEVLASIAAFAVGEGAACEIIAKRARAAIKATEENT